MLAERPSWRASIGVVLCTLGLALGLVWLTATPRVTAMGWRGAPAEPAATPGAQPRMLPGLLRQVFRGSDFEHLVYTGSDPEVRIRRLGTSVVSRTINGMPLAPELAASGPEMGLPAVGPFNVRWSGFLPVYFAGTYGFATTSDDGAVLRIGGVNVVSDWGPHSLGRRETRVRLEPGLYAVEIEYQQNGGDSYFDVEWRRPGAKWEALDGKALRHRAGIAGQTDLGLPDVQPLPAPVREDETTLGVNVVYRTMTAMPTGLTTPAIPAVPLAGPFDGRTTTDGIAVTRSLLPLDTLALAPETEPKWPVFAASWEGFLVVQQAGKHRFRITVDDGGRLQLGDTVLIEAWKYQDRAVGEGEADLQPGLKPFRLSYFNGLGDASLKVEWQQPGKPWMPIESSRLRRARRPLTLPSNEAPLWTMGWPDLELRRDTDLVSPFIHRWSADRDGYPRRRPRPLLRLEADLVVPESGFHTLWIKSGGTARVALRDERVEVSGYRHPVAMFVYLNAGQQSITVDYLGSGGGEALGLEWSGPSFDRRPVRARDLARRGPRGIVGLAAALVLLGLALMCADRAHVAAALRYHGPRAALGLIFVIAFCARIDSYQRLPTTGETDDEITPHLSGFWSARGLPPASWDCVRIYNERYVLEVFGRPFPVVLPFLEYPPLFDTAMGHGLRLLTAHGPFDLPLHLTRLVPILLSCWCLVLLYRLAIELELGVGIGLCAAALHALNPLAVLTSRLVKADSLLAVLALIALLATVRYRRSGRIAHLLLALACIPLAVLTKPTGLALGPVVLFPLAAARRPWAALGAVAATLGGFALWIGWGYFWDGTRFFELVRELTTTHHRTNLSAFLPFVTTSRITGIEWGAAWWSGLLLLGLGGLMSSRRAAPVLSLALFHLVAVASTYDPGRNFGWYRLPLYPPLAFGLAVFFADLARRADPARAFLAAGLLILPAMHLLLPEEWGSSRQLLQAVLLCAAALPSLALVMKRVHVTLARTTAGLLVAALLTVYALADARLVELYPPFANLPDVCPGTQLTE